MPDGNTHTAPMIEKGTNVQVSESGVVITISAAVEISTPASASATGVAGQLKADSNYLYICTATNTWRRIAHSTF